MNNEARKLLNHIYSTLKESQAGYRQCAQNAINKRMQNKFISLSAKHQQMLDALEQEAEMLGEKAKKINTSLGKLHKLYATLKSLVKTHTLSDIIEEIEEEEVQLIDDYENVLRHALPPHLQTLLQYQFNEIEKDFKQTKKFHLFYNILEQGNIRQ